MATDLDRPATAAESRIASLKHDEDHKARILHVATVAAVQCTAVLGGCVLE